MKQLVQIIIILSLILKIKNKQHRIVNYFPDEFDLTLIPENQNCDFQIKDEGICSANWRYILSQTLQNVLCIKKGFEIIISDQQLLDCTQSLTEINNACQYFDSIQQVENGLKYIQNNGLTSQECYGGNSNSRLYPMNCKNDCENSEQQMQRYQMNWYKMGSENLVDEVKNYLINTGPVIMIVKNNDQLLSNNGIQYRDREVINQLDDSLELGLRALKITGWIMDEESLKQKWTAANTWGDNWGSNGYIFMNFDDKSIMGYYAFSF